MEPESSRGYVGDVPIMIPTGTGMETKNVASGTVFTLTTEDPKEFPLPSRPLLEMQWLLHRVAAMSGAAEAQDDSDWDDNDEAPPTLVNRDAPSRVFSWIQNLPDTEKPQLLPQLII